MIDNFLSHYIDSILEKLASRVDLLLRTWFRLSQQSIRLFFLFNYVKFRLN